MPQRGKGIPEAKKVVEKDIDQDTKQHALLHSVFWAPPVWPVGMRWSEKWWRRMCADDDRGYADS